MVNEFQKNQEQIDKIINKINKMQWDSDYKIKGTPEYRAKVRKGHSKIDKIKKKQIEILKKKVRNKRFYFTPKKTSTSIYGGRYFKAPIFKQSKKGLTRVGEAKWNTASYRGADSEVLNQLVKDKVLPKEVLQLSKGTHSGSGYYDWKLKEELGLNIQEL